jgi:hypothetical protein
MVDWRPLERVQAVFSPTAALRRGVALMAAGKPDEFFGSWASANSRSPKTIGIAGRAISMGWRTASRTEGIRWLNGGASRHVEAQSQSVSSISWHGT